MLVAILPLVVAVDLVLSSESLSTFHVRVIAVAVSVSVFLFLPLFWLLWWYRILGIK